MTELKYFHDEIHHNLISPSIIVPYIVDKLNPKSVIDVGCGIGTFLKIFHENGVKDYLGIDGDWVNMDLLRKYIDINNFKVLNLEEEFILNRRFDLAITLEVAEHLKQESADIFIDNLVRLSDVIVFSAAFPGQGGQNHLNEQWPTYWAEKFEKRGYSFHDVLRPVFWNNDGVSAWYKQNMFLVVNKNCNGVVEIFNCENKIIDFLHPEYFNSMIDVNSKNFEFESKYYEIFRGKANLTLYFKLIAKKLLRLVGLKR